MLRCFAAPGLVELKRLVALPMCYGGFGIQQYQTTVSITYTSAKAASLLHLSHLGLLPSSDLPPPDLRAALRTMYTEQAAAFRADLPVAYHSTYDDHCNKSSYAFLTVCPTTKAMTLTDTEFQLGCIARCFDAGHTIPGFTIRHLKTPARPLLQRKVEVVHTNRVIVYKIRWDKWCKLRPAI